MTEGHGSRHAEHHALHGQTTTGIVGDLRLIGTRVAKLLTILDGIGEGTGALLDSSLVYWSMQYCCVKVPDQINMPVMSAGGARGNLKQGNCVDVRPPGSDTVNEDDLRGVPTNNLLVTLMNCMGLSSSDHESTSGKGYGEYSEDFLAGAPDRAFRESTKDRRSPVAFLYTGDVMG